MRDEILVASSLIKKITKLKRIENYNGINFALIKIMIKNTKRVFSHKISQQDPDLQNEL